MPTTTTIVNLPIQNRPAGTRAFDAPQPIASGLAYATLELPMNDPVKLSTGISIQAEIYFSSDGGTTWNFEGGMNWLSYGPNGYTVRDPDGTVRINPNPRLYVNLTAHAGHNIRCQAILPQNTQFGVLLTTTTVV